MRSPALYDLPVPPHGRTGWPWTEAGRPLSDRMRDGSPWPRISIVTPSLNQGRFLEEAIRSVLLQGYPDLEYIIIDGGSTDGTGAVIERYAPWLHYHVSEPDSGHGNAINKGFARATGTLFAWLGSDYSYLMRALESFAMAAREQPEAVVWAGACHEVGIDGARQRTLYPRQLEGDGLKAALGDWWAEAFFHQPASCMDAGAFRRVGGIDEDLEYAIDVDLWMRLADQGPFMSMDKPLACARMYAGIKTWQDPVAREAEMIGLNVRHGLMDVARARLDRFAQGAVEQAMGRAAYGKRIRLGARQTWRRLAQATKRVGSLVTGGRNRPGG